MLDIGWLIRYRLGDDDLVLCIDRRLAVVALHEAVAALHDSALWIGEIALRFRSRCSVLHSRHLVRGQRRCAWRRRIAVVSFRGLLRFVLRTGLGLQSCFELFDSCE